MFNWINNLAQINVTINIKKLFLLLIMLMVVPSESCDCNYQFASGCKVVTPAQSGEACYCAIGFFRCDGYVVRCLNPSSPSCITPGTDFHSCLEGQGNCGAYNFGSCDCNYHSGGCTINKPPPQGLACLCYYSFLWRCDGSLTQCKDPKSPFCQNPDSSFGSCQLGG